MRKMKSYLNTLTLNDIKSVRPATVAAFFEVLFSIIPTMLTFWGIQILAYRFVQPEDFDLKKLMWITAGLVLSILGQYIVGIISYRITNIKTYEKAAIKRHEYVKKLIAHPLGFFNKANISKFAVSFVNDFRMYEIVMSYYLPQLFALGCFTLLIVVFMMIYEFTLGLSIILPLPIVFIVFIKASRLKKQSERRLYKAKSENNAQLGDYIFGMKTLRNYNRHNDIKSKLEDAFIELRNASIKNETGAGTLSFVAINLVGLAIPCMSFAAAVLLTRGSLSVIDYVSVLVFATKVTVPMTILVISLLSLRTNLTTQGRLQEVISIEEEKKTAQVKPGEIVLKDLCFSYDEIRVLKHIDLTIEPNSLVALVGPSGCGKTTLTKVISKFYPIQEGTMTMSGVDSQEVSVENWLTHVTMVNQKPYLFNMSIKDNIAYGHDTVDLDDIISVAKAANCHDFIMELPSGYDTVLAEGGKSLSGGERQRIGIARALLKDASIVILDEPTSSLDFENEYMVQQAIARLIENKTVIMISHRLNTIIHADQIVVLNHGRVTGIGKHDELLKTNETYKKLVTYSLK